MSDSDSDNNGNANDVHVQIAYYPYDESKKIAEVADDEPLVLVLLGPKSYLLNVVEALASFGLEDEISDLLDQI